MTRKKELQPLGKQQPQGTVIPLREYLGTGDEHQAAVKWEKASTSGWRLAVPAFVIKTWSPQGKILVRFCCIKPARKLLSANEGSFSFGLHQVDFEKEHDSCPSLTRLFGNFVPGVHTALEIQVATVNTESTVGIYCLPKRQVHQLSRFLGSGSGILESTFLYQRPSQTYQCCRRKWGKLVGCIPGMLTWRCSTRAQSSGWLDPPHTRTAAPDVSWPCPPSQTPSPSQSLRPRQWCYRQCVWWISCEQKRVNVNQALPAANQ